MASRSCESLNSFSFFAILFAALFCGAKGDGTRLGPLLAGPSEALNATGTDDLVAVVKTGPQQCDGADKKAGQPRPPMPLQMADLGNVVQVGAIVCGSSPGGTRTPDQGSMSPLLYPTELPDRFLLKESDLGNQGRAIQSETETTMALNAGHDAEREELVASGLVSGKQ